MKDQKAKGITNAESKFKSFIEDLEVQLCGTCLEYRGIGDELIMSGAEQHAQSRQAD